MDPRSEAQHVAREILRAGPVYLDTETTGLDWTSEIVEICVLESDGSVLVDRLVRPTVAIPPGATRVHGIGDVMVTTAPTWAEIWPSVNRAISGRPIVIYNADYDLAEMRQSHRRYGLEWDEPSGPVHCLMRLYAKFHGDWDPGRRAFRWSSLQQAAKRCGISIPQRHRARQDAELARAVLLCMAGQQT